MLFDIISRLKSAQPEHPPLSALDAHLALGALMVRLAKADAKYAVVEIQKIDSLLARRFDLNPVKAAKMRADCEAIEKQAPETDIFIALIQNGIGYEERLDIFTSLWEVSMADDFLHTQEAQLLQNVGPALGINADDMAFAAKKFKAN